MLQQLLLQRRQNRQRGSRICVRMGPFRMVRKCRRGLEAAYARGESGRDPRRQYFGFCGDGLSAGFQRRTHSAFRNLRKRNGAAAGRPDRRALRNHGAARRRRNGRGIQGAGPWWIERWRSNLSGPNWPSNPAILARFKQELLTAQGDAQERHPHLRHSRSGRREVHHHGVCGGPGPAGSSDEKGNAPRRPWKLFARCAWRWTRRTARESFTAT